MVENGAIESALSLDGTDDYLQLENSDELQIQGEITLAAWVKPESKNGIQDIIAHGYTQNPNAEVFLRINNGQYQIGSWNGSDHRISYAVPTSDIGSWVHLCGTYDGTCWRLYRNGTEVASAEDSVGAVSVNANWTVGASADGVDRFFQGVVDEVKIYDSAISEDLISEIAVRTPDVPAGSWSAVTNDEGVMYGSADEADGQLRGEAEWGYDALYGSVLDFTGNNGSVSLGNSENLQIEGKITLSAWVCPNSVSGLQNILAKGYTQNPNGEICLRINNGKYQVGSWNGVEHFASFDIPETDIGEWVYLCGTYDGANWHLYRNGTEVATRADNTGAVAVETDWAIGSTGDGTARFFDGKVKKVEIYDTAVIPEQIATEYSEYTAIPISQAHATAAKVSFGGAKSTACWQEYKLFFNANGYSHVIFDIDWGDGDRSFASGCGEIETSHIYQTSGDYTITITKAFATKDLKEELVDIYGGNQQTVSVRNTYIRNGNFTELTEEQRQKVEQYGWWLDKIAGWDGIVEIRNGFVELDTDQYQPPEKDKPYTGNKVSIKSDEIHMITGENYRLSFDTSNRSDFAGDNLVQITVPGEILYINDLTVAEFLGDMADETARVGTDPAYNQYGFIDIKSNQITFSAGGTRYLNLNRTSSDDPEFIDTPDNHIKITSVVFCAASDSGSVIFKDDSIDYVSSFGPQINRVDIVPVAINVDLNADYENQGKKEGGWKYRNDRIEDMEDFPGYVIPMVPENSYTSTATSPYTLSLDCSNIDPSTREGLWIRVYAENSGVLAFTPIDTNLITYIRNHGEESSINIYGLPKTANASTRVIVEIYTPAENPDENVIYSSDSVKVTTSVFIMGDHTNYGQLYTANQDTRFMWDCDLATDTYATPKSEGKTYLNGKEDPNGKGDSYLESALNYNESGFSMDMNYSFDRNSSYGHLKPESVNVDKLSFVTNGGIKLGSKGGYGDGIFEVALLDVQAMVHMVFDKSIGVDISDNEFKQLATAITNPNENRIRIMVNGVEKIYQIEELSTLLNAVGYGQYYTDMNAYYSQKDGVIDYVSCLKKAYELCKLNSSMSIVAFPGNESKTYSRVVVTLNNTKTYDSTQFHKKGETYLPSNETINKINAGDGKIYLQAHWGTSITYTITSLMNNTEVDS